MNILHFSLHAFPNTISLLPHQWSWVPSFFLSYAATWYSNDILYFMTSLLLCHENLSPQKRFHIAESLPRISISQLFNKEQKKIAVNYFPASQKTAHFIPVIWTSGLVHCSKRRRYILLILVVIPSRMYTVSKLNKQNEQAWVSLQRWLNYIQFPYSKLFTNDEVHRFVKNKAVSVGSSEGYYIPTLLTTTAFILVCNDAWIEASTHNQLLNLFTIFVGYPGTGEYKICRVGFTVLLPTLSYLFPPFGNILHSLYLIWLVFQTHSV